MEEKYKVIKAFKDLKDNDYIYQKGDIYPRDGMEPTANRIKSLATKNNRRHEALIEKVEETAEDETKE